MFLFELRSNRKTSTKKWFRVANMLCNVIIGAAIRSAPAPGSARPGFEPDE